MAPAVASDRAQRAEARRGSPRPPVRVAPRQLRWTLVVGGLVGALLGFSVSFLLYSLLNPVLEDSTSWIRELQGLLWNLVLLGTLAGGVAGVAAAWLRRR